MKIHDIFREINCLIKRKERGYEKEQVGCCQPSNPGDEQDIEKTPDRQLTALCDALYSSLAETALLPSKWGAGKNTEKIYVEFFEEGNDTAIAKVANTDCDGIFITDHLITKVVDLSQYIGKNIYIKVTDSDDGVEYSYVHLDGFRVLTSDAEVQAAEAKYKLQIETYGEKPFEEDETSTTIQNSGFETGDLTYTRKW